MNDTEGRHEHKSFRTEKVLEQKENTMVVEADVTNPDGQGSHKETWKFIMEPPKGFRMEYLSGPMKGSTHSHTYTAMGDRTKVEVDGDFRIQGLDDTQTRKAILDYFANVFHEDSEALKKYK